MHKLLLFEIVNLNEKEFTIKEEEKENI